MDTLAGVTEAKLSVPSDLVSQRARRAMRQALLPLDVGWGRLLEQPSTRSRLVVAAARHVPRIQVRFALAKLATAGHRTRNTLAVSGARARRSR